MGRKGESKYRTGPDPAEQHFSCKDCARENTPKCPKPHWKNGQMPQLKDGLMCWSSTP